MTVSELALVRVGAWSTVRVKPWVTVPEPLVAVMVSGKVPVVVGVPAKPAVPLAPATKATPAGRVPVSVTAAAGKPLVVTGKLRAVPRVTVSELALVTVGAWSTVRVKPRVTVPAVLVAVTVSGKTPEAVAVPAMVAVPLAPSAKATPAGRAPVSVRVGTG